MKYIAQIIIILLISSCTSEIENKVKELENSKRKWLEYSINKDYSYILRQKCSCPTNDKDIKVFVKKGIVVSAVTQNAKLINTINFKTIKEYFKYIHKAIINEAKNGSPKINVFYDRRFGFPRLIDIKRNDTDNNIDISIAAIEIK